MWELPIRHSPSPSATRPIGKDLIAHEESSGLVVSKRSPRGCLLVPVRAEAWKSVHLCQFLPLPCPNKREKPTGFQEIVITESF